MATDDEIVKDLENAWWLLAISRSSGLGMSRHLIEFDFLNKWIPERKKIEDSINVLLKLGLIEYINVTNDNDGLQVESFQLTNVGELVNQEFISCEEEVFLKHEYYLKMYEERLNSRNNLQEERWNFERSDYNLAVLNRNENFEKNMEIIKKEKENNC